MKQSGSQRDNATVRPRLERIRKKYGRWPAICVGVVLLLTPVLNTIGNIDTIRAILDTGHAHWVMRTVRYAVAIPQWWNFVIGLAGLVVLALTFYEARANHRIKSRGRVGQSITPQIRLAASHGLGDQRMMVTNVGTSGTFNGKARVTNVRNDPNGYLDAIFKLGWIGHKSDAIPIRAGDTESLRIGDVDLSIGSNSSDLGEIRLYEYANENAFWSARWIVEPDESLPECELDIKIYGDSSIEPIVGHFTLRPKKWFGGIELVESAKRMTSVVFENRFPFVQNIGANCVLYRVAVRSSLEAQGVSLVVSNIEPNIGAAIVEIPLIQMHDRPDQNPGGKYKRSFDLNPGQPVYLDVVQKTDGDSTITVPHVMPADVDARIPAGDYRLTLSSRGPLPVVEEKFTVSVDVKGRLHFKCQL